MEAGDGSARRRVGRPLGFDREAALTAAMHVFWRHGFEASSIAALTRAMGVTPPSLYAAFGDKRRLFVEAVERYLGGREAPVAAIAASASGRAAAAWLMRESAVGFSGERTPPGCLLAGSMVSCSAEVEDLREELAAIRRAIEAALRARIERDVADGVLPAACDAEALAGHVFAVVQGMSTLAKDGAGRDRLLRIAASAMAGWPDGRAAEGCLVAAS